jgi:site-specific recombinase XerD
MSMRILSGMTSSKPRSVTKTASKSPTKARAKPRTRTSPSRPRKPAAKTAPGARPTLAKAIKAFFTERDLADRSRRVYETAYRALLAHYGSKAPVDVVKPAGMRSVLLKGWAQASPATWNVRVAALQSFGRYGVHSGWFRKNPAASLERRRTRRDESRAIAYDELAAMWSDTSWPLRDRLLWCCLYATAARAREVLSLNVEDLDLPKKRAWVFGKGEHKEAIVWDTATARMMRRYVRDRKHGPLFVTERRANVVPADDDLAPDGRARLSYQRAWQIFHEASAGRWTLHQIRHSRLTHLAETGTSAPLLMAKSRHQDLRTLARYARPGVEAVARLTAEHDPERRRMRR